MIEVNQKQLEFHLSNSQISYVFRVMEKTGILEQLYFGKKIPHYSSFEFLLAREIRPANNLYENDYLTSLEHIQQEMPVYGSTDFRYPAIQIRYPDGDRISHFRYQKFEIQYGKKAAPGLPGTIGSEAETLIVFLKDDYSQLILELSYTIFPDSALIVRQNRLINDDTRTFQLLNFQSFNLDLPNENFDWLHLDGAWARETQLHRQKINVGLQNISSTRGASSHQHNPFIAVCPEETTENFGQAYGSSLIYSGNFVGQLELDNYGIIRWQMGINPFEFTWELASGESFTTPEVVLAFSNDGLNDLSQTFHAFFRTHLINHGQGEKLAPVLLNTWEAAYFDFDEKKILSIAQKAQALGVDLLVLDDGWFSSRNSDNGSLGNWQVDQKKIPHGLNHLSQEIHQLGLDFGLWFEPEMISTDTPLFQKNPQWRLGHPKKNISHGRNQYVLDFTKKEVVEEIYRQMAAILASADINYIKWDMNRYISEAFSNFLPAQQQGEVFHRYILGVYQLLEKVKTNFPNLRMESCAGGGGRFDPGMLYYTNQAWISDDTDAVERLKIQQGASYVYPLSVLGNHLSTVPNHQTARVTPFKMRQEVALFGNFGLELDVTKLSSAEEMQLKTMITQYKKWQSLIFRGTFYRLNTVQPGNQWGWVVVSPDQTEALVGFYQILAQANPPYQFLKIPGLAEEKLYDCEHFSTPRYGADLAQLGLRFAGNYLEEPESYWQREMPGDFFSKIFYLKEK